MYFFYHDNYMILHYSFMSAVIRNIIWEDPFDDSSDKSCGHPFIPFQDQNFPSGATAAYNREGLRKSLQLRRLQPL